MKVKQISVFLENKSGRLAQVAMLLGEKGINIRALSIADTADFGILRLIVNDPDHTYQVLKEAGFTVAFTDVIAVEVTDKPGGLAQILQLLDRAGVNIEYLYAFVQKASNDALVVFRVEKLAEAVMVLQENGVRVMTGSDVYQL
ncbi:MAG: ACT domain-containing protein [Peptococcaceae bacterium]|nr:ACT domain-containing protein [Candidatus Syntrophopropionicum ammoniitolerans]